MGLFDPSHSTVPVSLPFSFLPLFLLLLSLLFSHSLGQVSTPQIWSNSVRFPPSPHFQTIYCFLAVSLLFFLVETPSFLSILSNSLLLCVLLLLVFFSFFCHLQGVFHPQIGTLSVDRFSSTSSDGRFTRFGDSPSLLSPPRGSLHQLGFLRFHSLDGSVWFLSFTPEKDRNALRFFGFLFPPLFKSFLFSRLSRLGAAGTPLLDPCPTPLTPWFLFVGVSFSFHADRRYSAVAGRFIGAVSLGCHSFGRFPPRGRGTSFPPNACHSRGSRSSRTDGGFDVVCGENRGGTLNVFAV